MSVTEAERSAIAPRLKLRADRADVAGVGRIVVSTFVVALCADLTTKAYAVGHLPVIYNDKPGDLVRRLAMSVVAVLVVAVLTRLAEWRGIGRI